MPAIGIDLGTTFSCVAALLARPDQKPQLETIANEYGNRVTPSCVAFTGKDSLIGEAAKHQILRNPKSTVFGVKRIIGRRFTDPVVQKEKKKWDFDIVDEEGKIKIEITVDNQQTRLYPEEISAKIIAYMKKVAEDYIGEPVHSTVITVPAYFNDSQRNATKDAAAIAGLHVLGMINEPTAAAMAYGLQHQNGSPQNILVYDLGGGTFDATVMTIKDGVCDVKATIGDTNLGGEDFTQRLFEHCADEFKLRNGNNDLRSSMRARYRLMRECEQVKINFSATDMLNQNIFVDAIFDSKDLDSRLTRASFEMMNESYFSQSLRLVEEVLREAKMEAREIDEVLLVGGSTRIPYIQEILGKYFGQSKIRKTINADEAVAHGAAIHASILSADLNAQTTKMARLKLRDVTPLSLGIAVGEKYTDIIIKRNTKIPTRQTRTYTTSRDNQDGVDIDVYEGESLLSTENNLLGSFELGGIPPMPAEVPNIEVCFEVDSNGVLQVSATETCTGRSMSIAVETARMSNEEIQRLIQQAEKQRKEDDRWKNVQKALNDFEAYVNNIQTKMQTIAKGEEAVNCQMMHIKCESVKKWIKQNQDASDVEIASESRKLEEVYGVLFPGHG